MDAGPCLTGEWAKFGKKKKSTESVEERKANAMGPEEIELTENASQTASRQLMRGERDLTQGGITSTLVTFAIPFFIANLLQALYGSVDLMIVGRFATSVADVSAVACGSQIITVILMTVAGLTTAGTVLIGKFFGARQYEEVSKTIGTMLSTFLVCTVLITALMFWAAPCLVRLLRTPEDALADADRYVLICSAGTIFIFGYNGFSAILRGVGNSTSPMIFVAIACVCNILLDLLLVGKYSMGAVGAAIATVGSQALSMFFAIAYIRRMGNLFDFHLRSFRIVPELVKKLFVIGLPLSVQSVLIDFSFMLIFSIINKLGIEASAGYGICARLNGFTMLFSISFGMALTAIVAQNLGAGQTKRALDFLKMSIFLSGIIAILLFCWMEFWPESAFMIFTKEPGVIAAGSNYMKSFCFDVLLVAFVFSANGFLNGTGHTRFTMVNNLLPTFLIRVPGAWLISRLPGAPLYGIGWAAPLASLLSVIITLIYLKTGRWKIKRI